MSEGSRAIARLLMVDDHPGVREGLRLLLEQHGFAVGGEAEDATSAFAAISAAAPSLVMVDLSLGSESGLALLRQLAHFLPGTPLLVYSMHEDAFHVQQAFAAGASGYVTKREITSLLIQAIEELLGGGRYVSPRARRVLEALDGPQRAAPPLSPRELVVYRLLGEGYSSHAIAEELNVSRRTVDSYLVRILEKLDAPGMEALRRRAVADNAQA